MTKLLKKLKVITIVAVLAFVATGCNKASVSTFNTADQFVIGVLDVVLKDKQLNVGLSNDQIESLKEQSLANEIEFFTIISGGQEMPDELYNRLLASYNQIFAKAEYSAEIIEKTSDGYTVEVKIKSLAISESVEEEILNVFSDLANGNYQYASDYDLAFLYYNNILDILEANIDNLVVGDETSSTVSVKTDGETFRLTTDDILPIMQSIVGS